MPKIVIPDKICPHCGGNEWYVGQRSDRGKVRTTYRCVLKQKEYGKTHIEQHRIAVRRWIKNNPEKHRLSSLQWMKRNPERHAANAKRWVKNNPERRKEYLRKRRESLHDDYIKKTIYNHEVYKGNHISCGNMSETDIIKRRAQLSAFRKENGKRSDSYIKGLIQTAVRNQTGEYISFSDISVTEVRRYRKYLRLSRFVREYQKLIS